MRLVLEDQLTPRELAAAQETAWRASWHHALSHSPYYRRVLGQAGFQPQNPVPLAELGQLPITDKTTLSELTPEFQSVPAEALADLVTTSGSTGEPLLWQLTASDLDRLAWNERLSFGVAGLKSSDTVLLAVTLDRCFMAGLAYFLGLQRLGCAVIRVGPAVPALHLDLLQRVRPTVIVGVPSFLHILAAAATSQGLNPAHLGVRKLVCIGETIRDASFRHTPAAESLARTWNAQLFSTYGVTELSSSLCECEHGRGGHLHPTLLHLEILDDAGQPVPNGQPGEVTATTLGVQAMPLIRYRTGDCAALYLEPCACGRTTPRLGPILGRKHHKLKLKGATLFPATLQAAIHGTTGVDAFIIVAHRGAADADDIEVRVACAGNPAPVLAKLRRSCQAVARATPRFTLHSREAIEALQWPPGARKRRHFIDLRSDPAGAPAASAPVSTPLVTPA